MMNIITVTENAIVLRIADELRELISEADGSDLLEIGVHGRLGLTLEWLDDDKEGTADNLFVDIIFTSGSLTDRHRVDQAPDFVDYLPIRRLVGMGDTDSDIDEVLQEWNEELPAEEDDDVDEDDPTGRIHRFEELLEGTPAVWPLARESLRRCIDQDVLDDLSQLVEEWLGQQQHKLDNEI